MPREDVSERVNVGGRIKLGPDIVFRRVGKWDKNPAVACRSFSFFVYLLSWGSGKFRLGGGLSYRLIEAEAGVIGRQQQDVEAVMDNCFFSFTC